MQPSQMEMGGVFLQICFKTLHPCWLHKLKWYDHCSLLQWFLTAQRHSHGSQAVIGSECILYTFTRRCPTILHRRFSPICDRSEMGLLPSEWQVVYFVGFSSLCLCFHGLCRDFHGNLKESLSFFFMKWTCVQRKLGQDLQTHTGHHCKQHPIGTATIQSWAHFNLWPSWPITAHIS